MFLTSCDHKQELVDPVEVTRVKFAKGRFVMNDQAAGEFSHRCRRTPGNAGSSMSSFGQTRRQRVYCRNQTHQRLGMPPKPGVYAVASAGFTNTSASAKWVGKRFGGDGSLRAGQCPDHFPHHGNRLGLADDDTQVCALMKSYGGHFERGRLATRQVRAEIAIALHGFTGHPFHFVQRLRDARVHFSWVTDT